MRVKRTPDQRSIFESPGFKKRLIKQVIIPWFKVFNPFLGKNAESIFVMPIEN